MNSTNIIAYLNPATGDKFYLRNIKVDPKLEFKYSFRSRFPDIQHPKIEGEKEIIWLEDPSKFFYVRTRVIESRRRSNFPSHKKFVGLKNLYIGYSVLYEDTPAIGDYFLRRVFFLRPDDLHADCKYLITDDHPMEGVDPRTIKPNFWGVHLQPHMHLYEGKF